MPGGRTVLDPRAVPSGPGRRMTQRVPRERQAPALSVACQAAGRDGAVFLTRKCDRQRERPGASARRGTRFQGRHRQEPHRRSRDRPALAPFRRPLAGCRVFRKPWCRRRDSNPRPTHYECVALPPELLRPSLERPALYGPGPAGSTCRWRPVRGWAVVPQILPQQCGRSWTRCPGRREVSGTCPGPDACPGARWFRLLVRVPGPRSPTLCDCH